MHEQRNSAIMLFIVITLNVLTAAVAIPAVPCGTPVVQPHTKRIVGGTMATPGSFPYVALMTDSLGFLQGVATLLDNHVFVTVAHHFEGQTFSIFDLNLRHWRLYAGEYNISVLDPFEQYYHIKQVIIHPQYNATSLQNDVALIFTKETVTYNDHTRPICLPDEGHGYSVGDMCYLPGWGHTRGTGNEEVLNQVELPILADTNCSAQYNVYLPQTELCAGYTNGGKDFCAADVGAPLLCKKSNGVWYMEGMASSGGSCTRADKPGVFEDMTKYTTWIKQAMQTAGYPYQY